MFASWVFWLRGGRLGIVLKKKRRPLSEIQCLAFANDLQQIARPWLETLAKLAVGLRPFLGLGRFSAALPAPIPVPNPPDLLPLREYTTHPAFVVLPFTISCLNERGMTPDPISKTGCCDPLRGDGESAFAQPKDTPFGGSRQGILPPPSLSSEVRGRGPSDRIGFASSYGCSRLAAVGRVPEVRIGITT